MIKRFFFLFLVTVYSLQAQALYTIIVGDSNDVTVGEPVLIEVNNLVNRFDKIATYLKIEHHLFTFVDDQTRIKDVLNLLKKIHPDPQDCVVFYFLGHGSRTKRKKSKWPNLYFTNDNQVIGLEKIIQKIRKKKMRFMLIVADCCNNYLDADQIFWGRQASKKGKRTKQRMIKNYNKLFIQSSGELIVSSSLPGTYSYCTDSGYIFTSAFLEIMAKEVKHSDTSWETILDRTIEKVKWIETPQYEKR